VDHTTARQRLADARVGRLYSAVDAKPKSTLNLRRLQNVKAHGPCSLLVDHYDEDWTALWWIRIDGIGRVIEAGDERDHALTLLELKYAQYRDTPPPGPVVALDIESWRMWP
jgi:PPOX class probable F420-dependent enzyme